MLHLAEIWKTIRKQLVPGKQYSLKEIYEIVESMNLLDAEDFQPQSPISKLPKWKRNVRNVLQKRKRDGEIIWFGDATYMLPKR